jgi:hypothetical protein
MGQKLGYAKKCYILSISLGNKSQKMYTLDGHILQVQNNPYLRLQEKKGT